MSDVARWPVDDRLAIAVDESHCVILDYADEEFVHVRHTLTDVGRLLGAAKSAWAAVRSVRDGAPPEDAFNIGGPIRLGEVVTTEQACRAVLRMVHSPIVGSVDVDSSPGHTFQRLYREAEEGCVYDMLSTGEKRLVDIAWAIWRPAGPARGEGLSGLGGIDRDNRRRVLIVLWYLHMGRDLPIEIGTVEWERLFSDSQREAR